MITKILKISASWCGPCRVMSKNLENFDLVPIVELDVEDDAEVVESLNVRNVPTLIFLDENEKEVRRKVGLTSILEIKEIIEENA